MLDWFTLDPRTLLQVSLLLVLLNAGAFAMLLPSLADELKPSARSWGLGIALQWLGGVVFASEAALKGTLPESFLSAFPHLAALAGMSLYVHALRRFNALDFDWAVLMPAGLCGLGIVLATVWGGGLPARILFTSLGLGVLLLMGIRLPSQETRLAPRVSRRVLRAAFATLALAVAVRAIHVLIEPPEASTLVDIGRGPLVLQLFLMCALPLVGTSAFFAMCSERVRLGWETAASTDFLTGLPNRRSLVEAAQQAIHQARECGGALSLAILDVDHFKRLNDSLGHAAGDEALKFLADRLHALCDASDLPARAGGEEFCLLSRGGTPEAVAQRLRSLQAALREHAFEWEGQSVVLSFSAGVAGLEPVDGSFDSLLGRADQALYAAKQQGRQRVFLAPSSEPQGAVPAWEPA